MTFEFPPPVRARVGFDGAVAYRDGRPGGEFIHPPAAGSSVEEDAYQAALALGTQLGQWGDTADWAAVQAQNLGTVVEDYGTEIEELGRDRVMPWAVPTVAPLSQSINRRADPTFQLSDLMSPLMRGQSDTAAFGGADHSHWTISEPWQMQRGMNTKGRIYYAFITPAVTRAYTQLNFMVSEVTSPCRMDIAVYVVDENRGMTRQVHATDALATLGFGESVVSVQFPTFVADQGSYLAIAFLQHGSGNTRHILGLDDTERPLLGSIFPPKISATNQTVGYTSLPSFIDGTNGTHVDFAGYWFTPYAELSEDVGIDYKTFNEGWWYDGGAVGRPWVALTSQGIGSWGGFTAAGGFGTRVSIYETPLSTDYVRIRSSVHSVFTNNYRRSTLVVRGSNDLRTGVGLSVLNPGSRSESRYELIQWSSRAVDSSWDDRTVLRTLDGVSEGDQLEIDYLDGLVTVRINGTAVFSDVSVSGLAGSTARFVGIQNSRGGNVFAAYPSPWLGPWSARDLPQDNGGGDDDGDPGEGTG